MSRTLSSRLSLVWMQRCATERNVKESHVYNTDKHRADSEQEWLEFGSALQRELSLPGFPKRVSVANLNYHQIRCALDDLRAADYFVTVEVVDNGAGILFYTALIIHPFVIE